MQKTKEPRLKPQVSIKSLFREWGLILFILVVIIVASTQRPAFLSPSNLVNILRSYSTYGIAALVLPSPSSVAAWTCLSVPPFPCPPLSPC